MRELVPHDARPPKLLDRVPVRPTVTGFGIALAVLLLVAAFAAMAQPTAKIYRIGYLALNSPSNPAYEAFARGLRELGYAEGQNVVIESRWAAGKSERLPALAAEIVRLRPDVIVTAAHAAGAAAKQATATIPIVMVNVANPVEAGFISTLARPGGNITGLTGAAGPMTGKRLELIKEVVPRVSRVAVLLNAANHSGPRTSDRRKKPPAASASLSSGCLCKDRTSLVGVSLRC